MVARLIFSCGFLDSAAAIDRISTPKNENAEIKIAERTPPMPCGIKPPFENKCPTPLTSRAKGQSPNTAEAPITINSSIATTLIKANQNSNSPKLLVLKKLAKLSKIIKAKA
ncbi:hypothetical protein D3C75_1122110 [compost metagenome]